MSEGARDLLVATLRHAYSGERAAGYAYRGHARSVGLAGERRRIGEIETEEWHHRRLVGEMLEALGASPSRRLEIRAVILGRLLQAACHVSGWYAPMYGAGRLESRNIKEYEDAARFARDCGQDAFVDCLLTMAEVEWEHERYFRGKAESHWLSRIVRIWPLPPPKESIRSSFEAERAAGVTPTAPPRP